MEKIKQSAEYYDGMFAEGGYEGVYQLAYWHSAYYPLFRVVLRELRRIKVSAVLEVGCGAGAFAHYLFDNSAINYRGFDFSRVAVEMARRRTGRTDEFVVGDATEPQTYSCSYDAVVCTEVLEHIERDLAAVDNWRSGCHCICSVPNFDAKSHVRFFHNEREVADRYGGLIRIDRIIRVRKPVLSDTSWRSYLRALRWNRYRPRQLAEILGLGSFDSIGGWFVFAGERR